MSTYFLAARDGGPGRAGDPSDSELATDDFATGAAAALVTAAARPPRAAQRPAPRRSMTLADLRLRLTGIEDSAAHRFSRGFEATGGGGRDGHGDGGKEGTPRATSVPFKKQGDAVYAAAAVVSGGVSGGSHSGVGTGTSGSGGSRTVTSSQLRLLTKSVAPAEGTGPPRRERRSSGSRPSPRAEGSVAPEDYE